MKQEDKIKLAHLISKTAYDQSLRAELKNNPQKIFTQHDIHPAKEATCHVVEDSSNEYHLIVPLAPIPESLTLHELPEQPTLQQTIIYTLTTLQQKGPHHEELETNPVKTLEKMGVTLPKGITVHVHRNTETEYYIALPPVHQEGELSDFELQSVVAGKGHHHGHKHSSVTSNTNVATSAEIATVAAEATSVVTTVAVAAEAVLVLT